MKKGIFTVLLLLAGTGLLFARGGADKKAAVPGITVIKVGTEGAYPPYNYVTSSGEADGYDVAVIRAVDELLPEYTFEFVPTAWDGIFVALEGGVFDLIASNLGWRQEREDKYYLSKVPYLWSNQSRIVFKAGRQDINSLTDLQGKKVAAGVGTATTTQLEQYLVQAGLKLEIVYTDGNIVNALTEIETGRVDATISSVITTQLTADSLGYKIDSSAIPEWAGETRTNTIHLLFPKTEKGGQLRDRIDGALQQLHDNGTLAELSRKYFFGKDYTSREAAEAN
ncbi:L-cystine transport system substrate-binding protein [Pillotina sp. SPG140]|jgi:L-cystine transport system substrate-binding protein